MTSAQRLRELINERLTAAAEEIFRDFQTTISEYEEEINRQRRLLDIVWKPEIKLHRIELPQQHVYEEEEVLTDQQLCDQERNSSLDQEEPEPPQIKEEQEEPEPPLIKEEQEEPEPPQIKEEQEEPEPPLIEEEQEEPEPPQIKEEQEEPEPPLIKEEQEEPEASEIKEELCTSLEIEPLVLKQETETLKWTPTCEESEDQTLDLSPDETQIDKSTTLKIHNNTLTGKQCFECDTCGKSFVAKANLCKHLKVHTGEKPYTCDTCGKKFSELDKLKVHKRVHTGEKPYPCNTCEKRFSKLGTLKAHMRTHTGEKPYNCKTCGKKFRCTQHLNTHMRTHR
ncbi:gastrula zinc finger protein XlCGF28.1-like [Scomber scombrus]|uniref:Gastrula zinc finger protein XlCGF28.1-like n=1 Tax=Scomber scombrus TaxID=13677 RepID=A0AAV1QIJ5_SCOSC